MNSINLIDKKELFLKYGKYLLVVVFLIVILIILKACKGSNSYNSIEQKMVTAASKYIKENNVNISETTFIDISKLGSIEGTELCTKSSGVLVYYNNNKLVYKPYLNCEEYETKVTTSYDDFITLKGNGIVFLNINEAYQEEYYDLKEDAEVNITGAVGKTAGIYTLYYNAYKGNELMGSATRIVVRSNIDKTASVSGLVNATDPIIILKGSTDIILNVGDRYKEPGYIALDYTDGSLNRSVKTEPSSIDTNKPGTYEINYTVTNSKGNSVSVRRYVTVIKQKSELEINATYVENGFQKSSTIKITVAGTGYSYMILPNGRKSYDNIEEYEATYNGNFIFRVYDVYGNMFTKQVVVNNIDSVLPNGTCEARVTSASTSIDVDAYDNKGISGYSYIIGNVASEYITENEYYEKFSSSKVSVKVKDLVGNENEIQCTVKKILSSIGKIDENGITQIISGQPSLEIPIETALKANGYTINDMNACIADVVKLNGAGTRYGVVAAAYGLIDCSLILTGRVLSYEHFGGLVTGSYCNLNQSICGKIGVNTLWGTRGGACKTNICYYGLNCATFVRWSLCNGGMNLCSTGTNVASTMASAKYFPGAEIVTIKGGGDALVRRLKPGDVIEIDGDSTSQHTAVVIGKDSTGIYTANDGFYTRKITYSQMTSGTEYRLLFLDNYYANKGNQNNLYK